MSIKWLVILIKSRILRWAGHVARMEVGRTALQMLLDKLRRKRLLGRPRHRCTSILE